MDSLDVVYGTELTVEWQRRSTGGIDFYFAPANGAYRAFPRAEVENAIAWSVARGISEKDWPVYLTDDHREIPLEILKAQNQALQVQLPPLMADSLAPPFLSKVHAWLLQGAIFCILPGEW